MAFSINIENATLKNKNYRKVIYTTKHQQLVLMSLEKNEFIHLEQHPNTTQFFKVKSGTGIVEYGKLPKKKIRIKDGMSVIIPPNVLHFIKNTGNKPLKLYTIYSPPEHTQNKIDKRMPV
jgi:mannose-6-phosphate isomerase-like protein (cupin superfamily)